MKYASIGLLAIIALCALVLTYDHFYGGTYTWTTKDGHVIATGKSYSECHIIEGEFNRCIRER